MTQQNTNTNNILKIVQNMGEDSIRMKIKKCCEKKINEILNKEQLTNEDIEMLNNLYNLYCRCKKEEENEKQFPYANTKEDYCILESAYLGNKAFYNNFILDLLLKVKIIEALLGRGGSGGGHIGL